MKILLAVLFLIVVHKNVEGQAIRVDTFKKEITVKRKLISPKFAATGQLIETGINSIMDKYRDYESNETVWRKIRNEAAELLFSFYRSGKLASITTSQAYFVKIGLQTMTIQDIAINKKVLIVGYAIIKPAEFEVIRVERVPLVNN
ncbi:MAG: hypothetical protein IPH18_14860 [Chitinophagaceae bacterium]|nr:hypothetical protein [Chitinophagaceae bacterium]